MILLVRPTPRRATLTLAIMTGAACQIGAYVMIVPGGPFPIMCVSYLLIGITLAIQAAQATGFVAVLRKNSAEKLSMLHGTYGVYACALRGHVFHRLNG